MGSHRPWIQYCQTLVAENLRTVVCHRVPPVRFHSHPFQRSAVDGRTRVLVVKAAL